MPIVITAAEAKAALGKCSSDLNFLWGAESVDIDSQAKFCHIGVVDIPKFSVLAKDDTELRDLLKLEFGLDKDTGLEERVKIGNILIAFQRAHSRTTKESELEAEFAAKRMTRPLRTTEYGGMRTSWESRWWKLDDNDTPARSYLEERCDQLESGDFHVEALSKIISRDEDLDPGVQTFFDGTGKLQIRKSGVEVALPSNPEQLRFRIQLWGVAMQMLGLKHSNQTAFQGLTPQHIQSYLSYLLGEYCYGLIGRSATGETVSAPSWAQLLLYEQQVRKSMYKRMMEEAIAAPDALTLAWKDPVIKERHFTTPTALAAVTKKPFDSYGQAAKASGKGGKSGKWNKQGPPGPYNGNKGGKGAGKGKGKFGQGKGKGKGEGKGDGKGGRFGECYPFNNHWERCTRSNCPFNHVCSRCGGKHPAYRCSNNSGPETQGAGAESGLPAQ